MGQLIPCVADLVVSFRDCFRTEVFKSLIFIAGSIVCVGPYTISEIWQVMVLATKWHHDTAYAVFHSACRECENLGLILATLILTHLVPGGVI